jgi:hypothetical protein
MAKRQPRAQPYLNADVLTQAEQAKHLGVKKETVSNLGHPVPVSRLTENPLGRVMNYDSGDTARTFRDPAKLQGVYGKTADPRSGISSEQNIDAWSRAHRSTAMTAETRKGAVQAATAIWRRPRAGRALPMMAAASRAKAD